MMKINVTPTALSDLKIIQQNITVEFGKSVSDRILRKLMSSVRQLAVFPESGIDLASRLDVECGYRCLTAGKNYVFYRIGEEDVHIIRVLNERQDFMNILSGIRTTSQETDDYWGE